MQIKILLAAAAFAASVIPAVAAPTVGAFDSGNCYPFNCNDSGTSVGQSIDYQELYSSSAFSGPLTISSVTFFNWTDAGPTQVIGGTYDISFGTTTDPLGSSGPVTLSNVAGFLSVTLSATNVGASYTFSGAPYSYDPSDGNLVMEVIATNQDGIPNGSGNGYFWADYTGSDVTRAYLISGQDWVGATGALVTEFNGGAVPEPSTWALMLAGFVGLGVAGYRASRRTAAIAV